MRFSIHTVYKALGSQFRAKRFELFRAEVAPSATDRMLDVGGYPENWTERPAIVASIEVLNVDSVDFDSASAPEHHVTAVSGDGRKLRYGDASFDIVYCNSVIEHVGTWDDQRCCAAEIRRVGKRLWVQTPARSFPIEPHFLTPFIHWLPIGLRRRAARFTVWALITHPTAEEAAATADEIRLLDRGEMEELFPDCEIVTERAFGLPKSYIALRR